DVYPRLHQPAGRRRGAADLAASPTRRRARPGAACGPDGHSRVRGRRRHAAGRAGAGPGPRLHGAEPVRAQAHSWALVRVPVAAARGGIQIFAGRSVTNARAEKVGKFSGPPSFYVETSASAWAIWRRSPAIRVSHGKLDTAKPGLPLRPFSPVD